MRQARETLDGAFQIPDRIEIAPTPRNEDQQRMQIRYRGDRMVLRDPDRPFVFDIETTTV